MLPLVYLCTHASDHMSNNTLTNLAGRHFCSCNHYLFMCGNTCVCRRWKVTKICKSLILPAFLKTQIRQLLVLNLEEFIQVPFFLCDNKLKGLILIINLYSFLKPLHVCRLSRIRFFTHLYIIL